MKSITTLCIGLWIGLCNFSSFAQSTVLLEHNNTRATLPTTGTFFFDDVNGAAGYEVPKDSDNKAIYSMKFQYVAKTAQDSLRMCWGGNNPQNTDVQSGAYSTLHNYDSAYTNLYQGSSWSICQEEIDIFSVWWEACNGVNADPTACVTAETPSNATLTAIYNWPAHGNVNNGENYSLADFYDHPESIPGTYDPSGGDYPIIKGCCATYMIQNDDVSHTYSGTEPIGLEMHYMFYHYKNWGLLNDVTFAEVLIRNLGGEDYVDFAYGLYLDTDLGNPFDDYIGTDSTRSMLYTYNGDQNDEVSPSGPGYGIDPPAFGITAINHPLTTAQLYQSANTPTAFWNVVEGLNPNGQPIVSPSGDTTKFMFNGNPNDANAWSEETLANQPGDRRGMMYTKHGPLAAGEEILQTYAFVYSRVGDRLENVDQLYADVEEVHAFYDTIALAQCNDGILKVPEVSLVDFVVAPNPASTSVTIETNEQIAFEIKVYDAMGKLVTDLRESSNGSLTVDVTAYENGVYLMVIESENQRITKRLVVTH